MSSPSALSARALDEALARLPHTVGIAHRGPDRLIVGVGGVFVLHPLEADEHPRTAAEHAHLLVGTTRDQIAQYLNWVPFVDWFIVDDTTTDELTLLPSRLMATTVLEGHSIPSPVVAELRECLQIGRLSPLWHHGLPFIGDDLSEMMAQMRPLA